MRLWIAFMAFAALASAQVITEFSIPTANSEPSNIVAGPDGNLWFTENRAQKIGRITTSGQITEFTLTSGNSPVGITVGPDGALWFAETSKIGRITTTGQITEFPLPTSNVAVGITKGPDGALWYTGNRGIGRMTTSGSVTTYPYPVNPSSSPGGDIVTAADGNLWFTAQQLGKVTPAGVATAINTSTWQFQPGAIAVGPDGALWVTAGDRIARVTTSGTVTSFAAPTFLLGGSHGITGGPDGSLWFTYSAASSNFIGQLTTNGIFNTVPLPTLSDYPWTITTGPDGALWLTEMGSNKIARVQVPEAGSAFTCNNTAIPQIQLIQSASAYGGYSDFASGSWLEIKGIDLVNASDPRLSATVNPGQWTAADFNGSNAPTVLDGVSVSINNKPGYVWYLTPSQINVQAPEDTAVNVSVPITVTNCKGTSQPMMFSRVALAPGFLAPANYSLNGKQYMVATFASDGAYVLDTALGASFGLNSRPAKPGDLIIAYGIGFGDVTPTILPGTVVGQSNTLVTPITFQFGQTPATITYQGLAGGFVGLYEFYINVPQLANGDYQITSFQGSTPVTIGGR